jgi:ABC-type amino acid transport substrate-binding protein
MLKRLIIAISVLLIATIAVTANAAPNVRLVTGEWPPYTDSQSSQNGMASEIVKAVFNDMGYTADISFLPFYLGYEKTLEGEFDGTFPYFYTPEREDEFLYSSNPLFRVSISYYYKKSNPELAQKNQANAALSIDDLYDQCVGLIQGYDYGTVEDEIVSNGKYRRYDTEVNAFRGLVTRSSSQGDEDIGVVEDTCGRDVALQVLPSASQVANSILENNFRDERYLVGELNIELGEDNPRKEVYFITKKTEDSQAMIDQFNASLEKLLNNDFIAAIERKYQEQGTDSSGFVRLIGPDSFPLVVAYESIDSEVQCPSQTRFWPRQNDQLVYDENCGYLIPKGTRALVVEWGEPFTQPGQVEINEQLLKPSRVKILEGPLKNKELYISNVYIEFE